MLTQQTITQLKASKLDGMARAFEEQAAITAATSLSFDERFGMIGIVKWRGATRAVWNAC